MSKSLLQQLYDGEIYPAEGIKCKAPEHRELSHKISDEAEHFKAVLSPEDWKRFEKLKDMESDREDTYIFANFTYGFQLGVGLMIEALSNGEGLIRNNE